MIEQLFGSKTRVKLLHLFYSNPNRSFYVREITRKIDEQINSVRRELSNLQKIGIIKSDNEGNRLYYEVNQNYEHYESLRDIFSGLKRRKIAVKTAASGDRLADRIKELGAVKLAVLTGAFTRTNAPIDLLIVGDVNRTKVQKLIAELEDEEGKELRYTVLSPEEYEYRQELNDRFITEMQQAKKTVVVDELSRSAEKAEKPKASGGKTKAKKKQAKASKSK